MALKPSLPSPPRIDRDSAPKPPLVAQRARQASHDNLGALVQVEQAEARARAAVAEAQQNAAALEREREGRAAAERKTAEVEEKAAKAALHRNTISPEARKTARLLGSVLAGALGIGAAGVAGNRVAKFDPPPAPAVRVDYLGGRVKALEEKVEALESWQPRDYEDRRAKERVLLAWACARGFRADNLDCEALEAEADPDDKVPARERARMTWRTRTKWPDPRKPPTR